MPLPSFSNFKDLSSRRSSASSRPEALARNSTSNPNATATAPSDGVHVAHISKPQQPPVPNIPSRHHHQSSTTSSRGGVSRMGTSSFSHTKDGPANHRSGNNLTSLGEGSGSGSWVMGAGAGGMGLDGGRDAAAAPLQGKSTAGAGEVGMTSVSSAEQKMVSGLITRLNSKLPSTTVRSLTLVEADKSYQQLATRLVEYSGTRLGLVVHGLMGLLEGFVKQTSSVPSSNIPSHVLQSQILILRLLIACLLSSWSLHLSTLDPPQTLTTSLPPQRPPPMEEPLAKYVLSVMTVYMRMVTFLVGGSSSGGSEAGGGATTRSGSSVGTFTLPGRDRERERENSSGSSATSGLVAGTYATKGSNGKKIPGLTNTMREVFRSRLGGGEEGMSRLGGKELVEGVSAGRTASNWQIYNSSIKDGTNYKRSSLHSTTSGKPIQPTPSNTASSQLLLTIAQNTAMITWILSSFNWNVVWARMRNRIGYLSSKGEEHPDAMEMVMLQWCNLDQSRLSQVLQEFSSNFLHIKRAVQPAIGHIIYETIRQWISAYPVEFIRLQNGTTKMQGHPENLFEILYSQSQSSEGVRQRPAIRPCEAMLLVLAPHSLKRAWEEELRSNTGMMTKKGQFLDTIRKGIRGPKVDEAGLRGYVEICRSALVLPANSMSDLVSIELDMRGDLRDRVLEGVTSLSGMSNDLARDGLNYLWLRQPETLLECLNGAEMSSQSRSAMVGTLASIALELFRDSPFDTFCARRWSEMESEGHIAARRQYTLRHLGPELVKFVVQLDIDAGMLESVSTILQLYQEDPAMAGSNVVADGSLGGVGLQSLMRQLSKMQRHEGWRELRPALDLALHRLQLNVIAEGDIVTTSAMATISTELLVEAIRDAVQGFYNGAAASEHLCRQMEVEVGLLDWEERCGMKRNRDVIYSAIGALCVQLTVESGEGLNMTLDVLHIVGEALGRSCPDDKLASKLCDILERLPHPANDVTSTSDQQKAIRTAFSNVSSDVWPIQAAWAICQDRFDQLVAAVVDSNNPPLPLDRYRGDVSGMTQEDVELFRSVGLWLATAAGVGDGNWTLPKDKSVVQALFPTGIARQPPQLVEEFVQHLVDILVADSAFVRATGRDCLVEMSCEEMSVVLTALIGTLTHAHDEQGTFYPSDVWDQYTAGAIDTLHGLSELQDEASFKAMIAEEAFASGIVKMALYLDHSNNNSSMMESRRKLCRVVIKSTSTTNLAVLLAIFQSWMGSGSNALEWACAEALSTLAKGNAFGQECVELEGLPMTRGQVADYCLRWAVEYLATGDVNLPTDHIKAYLSAILVAEPTLQVRLVELLEDAGDNLRSDVFSCMADGLDFMRDGASLGMSASTPRLVRLVLDNGIMLEALASVPDRPDNSLARALCLVARKYRDHGELALVKAVVGINVNSTDNAAQLLRANNLSTKILTSICMQEGATFFTNLIGPLVEELQQSDVRCDALDFGQEAGTSAEGRALAQLVMASTTKLLRRLVGKVHEMPTLIRSTLVVVAELAEKKFINSGPTLVSAVLMLRVLCPLLVSPERLGVGVDGDTRKVLLLISKLCNAAATGATLREPQLVVFNSFLADLTIKMASLLVLLASGGMPARTRVESTRGHTKPYTIQPEVVYLVRFVAHHFDELEGFLIKAGVPEMAKELAKCLPASRTPKGSMGGEVDHKAFYKGTTKSLEGKTIYYLILSRVGSDTNALAKHIAQTLAQQVKEFCVVVDLTLFVCGDVSQYAPALATLLDIPERMTRLASLVFFAPSFDLVATMRDVELMTGGKATFAASIGQLAKDVAFDTLDLPPSSLLISQSSVEVFELTYGGVVVRGHVMDDYITLQTVDKQYLGLSMDCACELSKTVAIKDLCTEVMEKLGGCDIDEFYQAIHSKRVNLGHAATHVINANAKILAAFLYHMTSRSEGVRREAARCVAIYIEKVLDLNIRMLLGGYTSLQQDRERAVDISSDLAAQTSASSLEVSIELVRWMRRAKGAQRRCLARCLLPWIGNIASRHRTSNLPGKKAKLVGILVQAMVCDGDEEDVDPIWHPVWAELGRSGDGLIDVCVEIMMQSAIYAGPDSPTVHRIAEAFGHLSSVGLLPRLASRWRKVVSAGDRPSEVGVRGRVIQLYLENLPTTQEMGVAFADLAFGVGMTGERRILEQVGRLAGGEERALETASTEAIFGRLLAIAERNPFRNVWIARIASLVTVSTFHGPNRHRSACMLAMLLDENTDDDLVYQIRNAIRMELEREDVEMVDAMVRCLAATETPSFWMAVALLQTACEELVPCALHLMTASLEGCSTLEELFTDRPPNLPLDEASGFAFDDTMQAAFAVACLMARCGARDVVERLLNIPHDGLAMPFAFVNELMARRMPKPIESVEAVGIVLGMLKAADETNVTHLINVLLSLRSPSLIAWMPEIAPTVLHHINHTENTALLTAAMELVQVEVGKGVEGMQGFVDVRGGVKYAAGSFV